MKEPRICYPLGAEVLTLSTLYITSLTFVFYSHLGDLAKAVRKKPDLHFGIYHSLFEWFNPVYLKDVANKFKTQDFVKVIVKNKPLPLFPAFHSFAIQISVRYNFFNHAKIVILLKLFPE